MPVADVQLARVKEELAQVKSSQPAPSELAKVNNPFVYRNKLWTLREILTVCLFGVWLVPLRIILVLILSVPVFLLMRLSISFGFDSTEPMRGWRRWVQLPVAYLVRLSLFIFGIVWVETTGSVCSTNEARTVVCAPHSTILDTGYLVYALRLPSAISKLENLSYPLFGVAFRAMQVITVDRSNKTNRHNAFDAMKARASNSKEQRHLLVFPEGTCTNREALITFKLGAFAAGKPVQPVALEWPSFCNWGGSAFNTTWTNTGKYSRVTLALHLLCQPLIRCRVHFLPVYYPNAEEQQDARLFADNVRAVIAAKLGDLPTTDHSIEDMFLAKEARQLDLDLPFEMRELQTLFEIDLEDAQKLLRRYGKLFKNKKEINSQEFAKLLGLPADSDAILEMFDLLKEGEDREIDFKHFLIGVCQLSRALNNSDLDASIELVWQACGGSGGGEDDKSTLTIAELTKNLMKIFPGKVKRSAVRRMFNGKTVVDYASFSAEMREQSPVLFAAMGSLANSSNNINKRESKSKLAVLASPAPSGDFKEEV